MKYDLAYTLQAIEEVAYLKKTDAIAYKKLIKLLDDIQKHPYSGIGKPERIKYEYAGCYSRRITQKHRLIYSVDDETITVLILSTVGHYDDK